jgi:hypothetical protein
MFATLSPPRLLLAAALTVSLGGAARAQTVVPSLALKTQHLGNSHIAWRFLIVTDTSEQRYGTMDVTTVVAEHQGKPALLSVRTFAVPGGQIIDSALAYRATLAPIWQHSHQPTKTMLLDFSATGVTGVVTPKDSATRVVKHPLGARVFDTTDLDEVMSSLPYAEKYTAVLPFYVFEHATIERDSIKVLGIEPAAAPGGAMRSAWKVSFIDPFITATFWIDRETRKTLRQDTTRRRDGARFRSVPLP